MTITFNEFKQQAIVYPKEDSYLFRNSYISKFVNTNSEHYKKYIESVKEYSDGTCYTGYLWDCLINPVVISIEDVTGKYSFLGNVLVFWDIHTKDRILIDDYWKFGKDTVIEIAFNTLLDNLNYLPEDIYICNRSLDWTLVLTHEDNNGKRICVKSGNI